MKYSIALKTTAYDTATIGSRQESAEFFGDVGGGDSPEAVIEYSESRVVGWLMSSASVRRLILAELGMPETTQFKLEIRDPIIKDQNQKPGDIDLLLFDCDRPKGAVAIEFKKIKARFSGGATSLNKLVSLERVVSQIEGLARIGFHKTFLGIVVLVDGRNKGEPSFVHRGLDLPVFERILEVADGIAPPAGVGVIYIEVVQAINKSIEIAGRVSVGRIMDAVGNEQAGDLTQLLSNLFSGGRK